MRITWHPALTLGALAAVWWLLSGGTPSSWVVGVPAVAAAAWAAYRLGGTRARPVSAWGLMRFLPFFLWESLRGGADVAMRTLAPRMRIHPGFTTYRISLRRQDARVLFANCVSLLPGSLAAELNGDRLDLHLLDDRADPDAELRRLERAVARVYPDIH